MTYSNTKEPWVEGHYENYPGPATGNNVSALIK